jgi:NAD(P)H-dependent FMN reductase
MLDHFLEEWFHKPAGVCCYSTGRFGGVRAAMQLRMILPELGMPTISSLLPVPHVARAVPLDGEPESWVIPAADRFLRELMWWAAAARVVLRYTLEARVAHLAAKGFESAADRENSRSLLFSEIPNLASCRLWLLR